VNVRRLIPITILVAALLPLVAACQKTSEDRAAVDAEGAPSCDCEEKCPDCEAAGACEGRDCDGRGRGGEGKGKGKGWGKGKGGARSAEAEETDGGYRG
jgi:hypothetical protein